MNEKGFSLIELLVVVAIIGIVATIAIPSYINARKTANETKAIGFLRSWVSAQELYKRANKEYASSDEDLVTQGFVGKGLNDDGTTDDNAFAYSITVEADDPDDPDDDALPPRWSGRAIRKSAHTAYRSFFVDQTGIIRARANSEMVDKDDDPATQ
jgi:type IV pilus assembly protein PilE